MFTRRRLLQGLAQIAVLGPLALRCIPRATPILRAGFHAQYIATIGSAPYRGYATIGAGPDRDYATLSAWEATTDYDLVLAGSGEVAECYEVQQG